MRGTRHPARRRLRLLVATIALSGLSTTSAAPQAPASADGPDPREIPVPPIRTSLGTLPGVEDLPVRVEMPDVMTKSDGQKVTTVAEWKQRREEMKRVLAYYAVGRMPPAPGNVRGREVASEAVLDGKVKYRLVKLTFGPERRLELSIGIFTPAQGGPFPTVILPNGTPPGSTPLQLGLPRLALLPRLSGLRLGDPRRLGVGGLAHRRLPRGGPYAFLGAADRLGVNYAKHGHAFTEEDWIAMLDFADKHLRGLKVDRTFERFPP